MSKTAKRMLLTSNFPGEPSAVSYPLPRKRNGEFPVIVTCGKRAFYKVGTRDKGLTGVYEECDTLSTGSSFGIVFD